MILTDNDMIALTTLHGNAVEYQEAQRKLFAVSQRWCPACHSILPISAFREIAKMELGRGSRCHACEKSKRRRSFMKLSDATRRARFLKRNPGRRPKSTRGPYAKTAAERAAGTYIVDPIHDDLWLATPSDGH